MSSRAPGPAEDGGTYNAAAEDGGTYNAAAEDGGTYIAAPEDSGTYNYSKITLYTRRVRSSMLGR
jgi:hypothetical protein